MYLFYFFHMIKLTGIFRFFIFHLRKKLIRLTMVLKFLVYGSLKSELALELLQLKVIQKYVHYRIVLTYFDQHFHHHVKLKLKVDLLMELRLEHLLQSYRPRSRVGRPVTRFSPLRTVRATFTAYGSSRIS